MKRTTLRRFVSATLVTVMVLGTTITGSAATTFSDVNGHWAAASINYGVANGFIKGYTDGTFKPDNPVTRAEFSKMLNVAYGIENTQAIGFSDVYANEWYYSDVRKSVAAGYINGYEDNTFRPNSKITRQEAAIMIASVIPIPGTSPSLAGLVDNASIADWARAGVVKVYAKGYMRGDNNNMYNPTKSLTRAEAATILSNIVSKENIISSDMTISTTGKVLSDTIYANDINISKNLGNGSVELDACMVLGTLNVLGGGENSVKIIDTGIHNMTFAKSTGDVRVFLTGNSAVKDTQVVNGGTLEQKSLQGLGFQNIYFTGSSLSTQEVSLIGSFPQLYVDTASTIKSTSGTISNVTITSRASGDVVKFGGTFTNVIFEAKTLFELLTGKINNLTVNSGASSSTIKLNSSTSIATAVINATKTAFTGSGSIARLEANANDITYETKPTRIVTGSNVSREPSQSSDITAPVPTFIPANSATGVLANTKITITFNEPIFLANGNAVLTGNIPNIIEFRKTSSSGSEVPYTATINTAKTIITLTPTSVLDINTNYYVIVLSGTIEDELGNQNSKITSTFKTGSSDVIAPVPTFVPANAATGIPLDSNITITFNEPLYNSSGSLLTSSNFNASSVILKTTNANGTSIPFAATYSGSTSKTITINPTASLEAGTYYVAVKASIFQDSAKNVLPLTSITFSTLGATFPINIAAITGVTAPVLGAIPVTTIAETSQYTGTVAWSGTPSTFGASTGYTATITLTPKTGYTLTGVASNFFTVTGAISDTNSANSGVVTVVFQATAAAQTLTEAKNAADAAVAALTVSNATDASNVLAAVNAVITNTNITSAFTTAFVKNEATIDAAGTITGTITLTNSVGPATMTVEVARVIAALPAQTLAQAKNAADTAVAALTVSNATDASNVLAAVNAVITNTSITSAFTAFVKVDATVLAAGTITGTITLTNSVDPATTLVDVFKVIPVIPVI